MISHDSHETIARLSKRSELLTERIRKVLAEHFIHFEQNGYNQLTNILVNVPSITYSSYCTIVLILVHLYKVRPSVTKYSYNTNEYCTSILLFTSNPILLKTNYFQKILLLSIEDRKNRKYIKTTGKVLSFDCASHTNHCKSHFRLYHTLYFFSNFLTI